MTAAVIVLLIANLALVVLVLYRILFAGTDGADCELQVDETPFARLRGRSILLRGALAVIPAFVLIVILWPEWLKSGGLPVPDTLLGVLHFGIFYLLVARMLSTSRLPYSSLFGHRPRMDNTWTIHALDGTAHNHVYRNNVSSVFSLVLSDTAIC